MIVVRDRVLCGSVLGAVVLAVAVPRLSFGQPLSDWSTIQSVTVDNLAGPDSLFDYPVRVVLSSETFSFPDARPDGADLRFVGPDGETQLGHWIESWNPDAGSAAVWVRIPMVPAAGSSVVNMLYGNPEAPSAGHGGAVFPLYEDFERFFPTGLNAPVALDVPTYDGSSQVVHPDVIHVPGGWNGFEYWMAMTPYPESNEAYENPSIVVSDDGIHWAPPPGGTNPLVPQPPGFNNDPDLLLVDDVMVLYFNETNDDGRTYEKRMTSTDGIAWTEPEVVCTVPHHLMSPSVVYDDGLFRMWYLRSPSGCSSSYQNVYLRTSLDGVAWGPEQPVSLAPPGLVPWHFDIVKSGNLYRMLYIAYPAGHNCTTTQLYYAESEDGLTWTPHTEPVLVPSNGGWDAGQIYRSTFLVEDQRLRIWYSARSVGEQWHVGYTEGPLADFEAANESPWEDVNGSVAATTELPRSGTHGLVEVGGPAAPQAFLAMESHESVSVWMFDDLGSEPDRRNILRVWDPGNPTYPLHAIGVGIDTGQSVDHYVIHTEGWIYSTTSVPRTYGWHLLSIRVRSTACDLLIDGQVVGTLTVLRESRVNRASIEGSTGGPGWFDDAYIRPFAWPEPSTSVGPATPASIDPEIVLRAVLDLQAPVPNPVRTSTRIGCSLPSPSHLRARIFAADGRLTRTLADGPRPAGRQEMIWNGCDQHGTPVPSGIYFVRIDAGGASRTRKLMVVR